MRLTIGGPPFFMPIVSLIEFLRQRAYQQRLLTDPSGAFCWLPLRTHWEFASQKRPT